MENIKKKSDRKDMFHFTIITILSVIILLSILFFSYLNKEKSTITSSGIGLISSKLTDGEYESIIELTGGIQYKIRTKDDIGGKVLLVKVSNKGNVVNIRDLGDVTYEMLRLPNK